MQIGGIEIRTGQTLGEDVTLADLQAQYDAVFPGIRAEGAKMAPRPMARVGTGGDCAAGGEDLTVAAEAIHAELTGA